MTSLKNKINLTDPKPFNDRVYVLIQFSVFLKMNESQCIKFICLYRPERPVLNVSSDVLGTGGEEALDELL